MERATPPLTVKTPYTIVSLERARAHLRAWVASHRDDDRPGMERYVVEVEAVLDRLDELEKRR